MPLYLFVTNEPRSVILLGNLCTASTLGYKYGIIMNGIYHAVLQTNSPRPESGQVMFKPKNGC